MSAVNNNLFDKERWYGIQLSELQCRQFNEYYNLLTEWNKVMNLTAITEYNEVVLKHFIDSLALVRVIDLKNVSSLIDVGTGAGFPGIPLKIVFPHLNIVLLDSLNKRVKFLDTVIRELQLKDISAVHGRAEDIARREEYRENFDCCVSRAVANLSTLCEYCLPFVKCGGYFVPYKSGEADDEIKKASKSVKVLGGKIDIVDKFILPEENMGRSLIKIEKKISTPKKFPRKAGIPGKEPIM